MIVDGDLFRCFVSLIIRINDLSDDIGTIDGIAFLTTVDACHVILDGIAFLTTVDACRVILDGIAALLIIRVNDLSDDVGTIV